MSEEVLNLRNIEAIMFVSNAIWSKEQASHLKLNILDTITIADGCINGWLFTSVDGMVKSKSQPRWNVGSLLERLTANHAFDVRCSHTSNGNIWSSSTELSIKTFPQSKGTMVLVSHGHLSTSIGVVPSFIEHTVEFLPGKIVPKHTTFMLCGIKSKGALNREIKHKRESGKHIEVENIMPPERVPCLNKEVMELCKVFAQDLAKAIEPRTSGKILKMTIVVVAEFDGHTISSVNKGDKKVWLHHVKEISCRTCEMTEQKSLKIEKRSATCSTITSSGGSYMRLSKCVGDFCTYNEEEEVKNMHFLRDDAGGDIRHETIKAMRRHRRLRPDEVNGDVDDVDAESDEDGDEHVDVEDPEGPGHPADGDAKPIVKSQSRKVPHMSISLAREDMVRLEAIREKSSDEDRLHFEQWPEQLVHWWTRLGRTLQAHRKGGNKIPTSSAHAISASLLATMANANGGLAPIAEDAVSTRDQSDSGCGGPVDSSRGKGTDKDSEKDLSPTSRPDDAGGSSIPFDLTENAYSGHTRRNVGQLCWYYSDARVCDRCYQVYGDLDRRRRRREKLMLREKRKAQENEEIAQAANIETRIFLQRKLVSRLAKDSKPPKDKTANLPGNMSKMGVTAMGTFQSSVSAGLFNGSIMSSQSTASFGVPLKKAGLVGAPKGVLPPLPWQLSDKDEREKYETGSSAFIRNIRSKAQEMASIVHHEKMMTKYKQQYDEAHALEQGGRGGGGGGGGVDPMAAWNQATGQRQEAKGQAQPKPRRLGATSTVKKVSAADFDSARLLHPWQRELQQLKQGQSGHGAPKLPQHEQQKQRPQPQQQQQQHYYGGKGLEGRAVSPLTVMPKVTPTQGIIPRSTSMPSMSMQQGSLMSQLTEDSLEGRYGFGFDNGANATASGIAFGRESSKQTQKVGVSRSTMDQGGAYSNDEGDWDVRTTTSSSERTQLKSALKSRQRAAQGMEESSMSPSKLKRGVSFSDLQDFADGGADFSSKAFGSKPSKSPKSPGKYSKVPSMGAIHGHNEDDDDDDDDDEEIGWSPFCVPTF